MASLWSKYFASCKSRLSAIARSCFLGRQRARAKVKELKQRIAEQCEAARQSQARIEQLEAENRRLQECVREAEAKQAQATQAQPVNLPIGEVPPGQQFGAGMMTLCVNLARAIGLRPTTVALGVFFAWLNLAPAVPTYQTIRGWMQRIGLDRMQNVKKTDGGVWLTDHSNQIGKEKVLTIMRVRHWQPGVPLRLEDMDILTLAPGEAYKREDVAKEYQATAARCGVPRAVETDGAVELREPVETLGKRKEKPLTLRDPKHFLANQLEALLKQDGQWEAFTKQLGGTRSALQQTELAHFIPPSFKTKARFMNLAPTLHWATTVLWHLGHPESQSRQNVTPERMREKLGWLEEFAPNIAQWQECQAVISTTLTLLNTEGIFQGVTDRLQERVAELARGDMSRELLARMMKFLDEHEAKLKPGERMPLSTEIVESAFGKFKQLERQHARGGFTGLLLTFPVLLRETTPEEVRESVARVKVADVKQWEKQHLPRTLAARRQLMFREANPKASKAKTSATPMTSTD